MKEVRHSRTGYNFRVFFWINSYCRNKAAIKEYDKVRSSGHVLFLSIRNMGSGPHAHSSFIYRSRTSPEASLPSSPPQTTAPQNLTEVLLLLMGNCSPVPTEVTTMWGKSDYFQQGSPWRYSSYLGTSVVNSCFSKLFLHQITSHQLLDLCLANSGVHVLASLLCQCCHHH